MIDSMRIALSKLEGLVTRAYRIRKLKNHFGLDLDNAKFVSNAYREILHREADDAGMDGSLAALNSGVNRDEFLVGLLNSEEFQQRLKSSSTTQALPNLVAQRPEKYSRVGDFLVFSATADEDYEWLEEQILVHGYYERRGSWGYELDFDKRLMAQLVALLSDTKVFELGCGVGLVMQCLDDLGVEVSGLDVSEYSKQLASSSISQHIKIGDFLDSDCTIDGADIVVGLDVFEHITPKKLDKYLEKCASELPEGGLLFLNVPAFGADDIFGMVHSYWISNWRTHNGTHELFKELPCDESGFPLMGHLVWADSVWWESRLKIAGFTRIRECEKLLHKKFDHHMSYSEARKSYFLLAKGDPDIKIRQVSKRINEFIF